MLTAKQLFFKVYWKDLCNITRHVYYENKETTIALKCLFTIMYPLVMVVGLVCAFDVVRQYYVDIIKKYNTIKQ